ncbi:MAG: hypothetical protein CMN84_02975 [Spongiibacteraceae bacterium]|nr:hypothetical protein [Spongiibacteraceae bacterium]
MLVNKRYLFLLSVVFYGVALLIPNHYFPWTTFYSEFFAIVALFFLAGIVAFLGDPSSQGRVPASCVFVFLYSLIPLVQYYSGQITFYMDMLINWIYLVSLSCSIYVGFCLYSRYGKELLKWFAVVVLSLGLVSAMLAITQWLLVDGVSLYISEIQIGSAPYANLNQPNNLASLLIWSFMCAMYLRIKNALSSDFYWFIVIILMFVIALTGSETSWLVFLVAICFFSFKRSVLINICTSSYRRFLLSVGAYMFFYLLIGSANDALLISEVASEETLDSHRLSLWAQFFIGLGEMPSMGFGWGQTALAQLSGALVAESVVGFSQFSHNVFLDLVIWNGWFFGGIAAFGLLYFCVYVVAKSNDMDRVFMGSIIGVLCVHAMVELPHAYAYFLIPTGLIVGAYSAASAGGVQYPYKSTKLVHLGSAGLISGFSIFVAAIVWIDYRNLEEDYRRLRFKSAGIVGAGEHCEDRIYTLDALREFICFAGKKASENMSDERLIGMREVVYRFPYAPSLFRYFLALEINDNFEESGRELTRIRNMYPKLFLDEVLPNIKLMKDGRYPNIRTADEIIQAAN